MQWTNQSAECSPRDLPAPLQTKYAEYVSLPAQGSTLADKLHIRRGDSVATYARLSETGAPDPAGPFVGPSDPRFAAAVRTRTFDEGAREGGVAFTVTEVDVWHVTTLLAVETMPGTGIDAAVEIGSTSTYTFHQGGITGPVYTTCVVHDTASGSGVLDAR